MLLQSSVRACEEVSNANMLLEPVISRTTITEARVRQLGLHSLTRRRRVESRFYSSSRQNPGAPISMVDLSVHFRHASEHKATLGLALRLCSAACRARRGHRFFKCTY